MTRKDRPGPGARRPKEAHREAVALEHLRLGGVTFSYYDGVTQSVTTDSPCVKPEKAKHKK
jgi:hypothetical protein